MFVRQLVKAQHIAELNGWTKFVSMQNHYNLVYREEEREIDSFVCGNQHGLHSVEPNGTRVLCPQQQKWKRNHTLQDRWLL